jgi:DNA methylase
MAKRKVQSAASANGRDSLDPVTKAPVRPAGAGMYLHWEGRKGYRTRMPAPRVLEPVPALSYGDQSDNRVIEGDNLQVMVSLRSQYQGAVDVAYLDPPYNTGKRDFAYSDRRFHDPNADAEDMVYVSNEDGGRHTKWLNYMGPRLWLTWQLLADHGVCFVSINDVELFRLGMLMDEIFGEKNRIAVLVWKQAVDNNPTRVAVEHEYVLCYAKHLESVPEQWKGVEPAKEWLLQTYERLRADESDPTKLEKAYRAAMRAHRAAYKQAVAEGREDDVVELGRMDRYRHIDARGPWAKDWHLENPKPGGYSYDIPHPVTGKPCRKPPKGYRYPPESMEQLLENDLIVFGKDHTETAQLRRYLKDAATALRSVITIPGRNGSDTLNALIPGGSARTTGRTPLQGPLPGFRPLAPAGLLPDAKSVLEVARRVGVPVPGCAGLLDDLLPALHPSSQHSLGPVSVLVSDCDAEHLAEAGSGTCRAGQVGAVWQHLTPPDRERTRPQQQIEDGRAAPVARPAVHQRLEARSGQTARSALCRPATLQR